MQKICVLILLSALASNYEAVPQTKWSRPVRNPQGQLTRERRQFPFGEWVPLSQPCPTCRPFADPLDAGLRGENIGLTPPRPPTVTRQIHGEGNFFPQDESSILSVPPPPPSAIPRHPIHNGNGNFQFSSFGQQFNNPLPVPTQKIFPQTQQIQFLPQTFLPNQALLVNGNQQILSGLNAQNNIFGHQQNQQQVNNGKVAGINSEFKSQKIPENVLLEQNKRPVTPKQAFPNKPQPFTSQQQNQQTSVNQQTHNGQQQHSVNFENSILTPPPAPKNVTQDIVIPGLDKEEIQLLYVPVETLRQRGTPQEQLLTQHPQNIQFYNRQNGLQRPANNARPTEQTVNTEPKGHFITQNANSQGQSDSSLKVTSTQIFPTTVTPSSLLLQHLPFQTPQPFVSATPATPTIQPFVTPASVFQKFSPFTPETTLPHLSTISNSVQFTQSDIEFGTTPKTIVSQGGFTEEIINGKSQLSELKSTGIPREQGTPLQSFSGQQPGVTQQPQVTTIFSQGQQKELLTPTHFPVQIDQHQINIQKQQEQQRLLQQQRQKELEEQRFLEQQRKQKELEEQRFLEQQRKQKELEEQRLLQQQQRQKELEEQRFLQKQKALEEQRQKELEQQRFLQKQKEIEEQRLLQQRRQKELEQQRLLQKQKEIEEQRLLQQRRQKELEQQRFFQKQRELEEQRLLQQRQKDLEEQRFLQEQRQKELENQRRLQLQKQKELEEKQRLQLKQKEEEERLLRFQQQQKELQQQRLLQQQQEEQQRELQQQKLQKQKQENLKKQQQFQFFQQQKQNVPQQGNRHVLPANDNLNFIPQLEKESEADQQLVPHQPPLSVFFKGHNGAEVKITDVLRELRSSNTITVLDQYFEKMPTVFVGPAGLIPPHGYGKFDLPYLSNIESNRIERRIDKLPFFVAPLNFVPPPGYAKIPFPAPHVGSVVVSSESNPAMNLKTNEKGSSAEENSGSFPVVGPELPGLINNLDTITTTIKPTTYTPSLPQTTAQLRSRRPNNSVYKPQSRKPITRTRPTTTSKPEEVTQPIQKAEVSKDSEGVFRKPFNRFLNRRRQQTKTTTEIPIKSQQDGKNLENRHYSVESYNQEKNQFSRTQQKSDVINEKSNEGQFGGHFEQHSSNLDGITANGQGVFDVRPIPEFSKTSLSKGEEHRPEISDYADVNLQSYEDGPLPTGSAKTITQELYRPNSINQAEINSKTLSKPDSTQSSIQFQPSAYEEVTPTKLSEISDASPTVGLVGYQDTSSEGQVNVEPTSVVGYEKQDVSSERFDTTELPRNKVSYTTDPASSEQQTKGYFDSNEQYTSAFAEISKPHHIPGYTDSSRGQNFNVHPTQEISVDLEAPLAQSQESQGYSQSYDSSSEIRPTSSADISDSKFAPTGSSNEQYSAGFEAATKNQQSLDVSTSQISPTAPGATETQYATELSANSQRQPENNRQYEDQRIGSFISVQDVNSNANPQQYHQISAAFPSQVPATENEYSVSVEQSQPQISSTHETIAEVTANPSVQTYRTGSEGLVNVREPSTEGHGQDAADILSSDHRVKLPNPAIVRVRTRVRGKPRGQVNFAASQTTTHAPFVRSTVASRHTDNTEQEFTTKINHVREYNPVKISKYNQFRGVKKPLRTTTEATARTTTESTEYEQKANVYTVRPHRRPLNPSTVSTKRIRRPTTPLPSAEGVTEAFGTSTPESHSHSQHSDISPSGVSNDVYYEQSSLSPVKHKFRKHFGTAEQKNDVVPAYVSTSYPSVAPSYSTFVQDAHSDETHLVRDSAEAALENSEKYPEWNPSESGIDVSGIVLTTTRTPGQQQEEQVELEEPKKSQDNKKAFDPDLEKKTGRRRVRVRVHKRPHENFETAESQNLRTVANVLVPPTTTYKPNDESSFHQLAKNADFSFGGQKLFGIRSREYFRKRLNLTQSEAVSTGKGEQAASENVTAGEEATERSAGPKISGFLRKAQKNEFESSQTNETSEGDKIVRPKFRGFVRKIIKHGGANKETDSEQNQLTGSEANEKHEEGELHSKQTFRVNQGGLSHAGRVNGTRHKTFVRYVKKNKIKHHETESHQEFSSEQKEEQGLHQTTESHTEGPQQTESQTTEEVREEKEAESKFPVYPSTEQTHNAEPQDEETTEPESKPQSSTQTTSVETSEIYESSSLVPQESSTINSPTPLTQLTGLYLTQRPKFYQTLRPVFQRTNGFQRTREPESPSSTTEQSVQEPQEKRNGFARLKYGKTTGFGSTANEKSDEIKKVTEQQLKNKNLHTLEVRKYLRTKIREGGFSQFSKNKYFTSEKTETAAAVKERESEPEETTTERAVETTSVEPKTTQAVVASTDSAEVENEAAEDDEEPELHATTTEAVGTSEEESSEEDLTDSDNLETTTELPTTAYRFPSTSEIPTTVYQPSNSPEVPTTVFQPSSSPEIPTTIYQTPDSPETTEVKEVKTTTIQTTEAAESQRTEYEPDIYRFSKHSFSFDEAEHFTGTKNRAHVRNITTDIIENTASFSAPGVEKRPEISVVTHLSDVEFPTATESQDSTQKEKTEATTTESQGPETTTDYPETGTTASTDAVTKAKIAKILKTSTTTKVSHETEICYRGRCIRTKSENPDEDLKLLVDSASTMKIEKTKRGTS